jgi:hypothetical protein
MQTVNEGGSFGRRTPDSTTKQTIGKDYSVLSPEKVFLIAPFEVRWLKENHPTNYKNLQDMITDGRAQIVPDMEGSA